MDLKLHLLETFPARGSDGHDYKVCAYERLRRDDTIQRERVRRRAVAVPWQIDGVHAKPVR